MGSKQMWRIRAGACGHVTPLLGLSTVSCMWCIS
jgi:hypothetical protein